MTCVHREGTLDAYAIIRECPSAATNQGFLGLHRSGRSGGYQVFIIGRESLCWPRCASQAPPRYESGKPLPTFCRGHWPKWHCWKSDATEAETAETQGPAVCACCQSHTQKAGTLRQKLNPKQHHSHASSPPSSDPWAVSQSLHSNCPLPVLRARAQRPPAHATDHRKR